MNSPREPIFNIPGAVLGLTVLLLAIHGLAGFVVSEALMVWDFSFIPARIGLLFGADPVAHLTEQLAAEASPDGEGLLGLARAVVAEGDPKPWTMLTYALLHGSWAHVLLNCVWLVAFGSAVARRFGSLRFLGLMVVSALGGSLAHLVTHPAEIVPMVGASASVSGAMAAAMRFAFQPGAPLGVFRSDETLAYRLPALPLRDVLSERRVMTFVVVWFVLNILTGLAAPGLGMLDAAVAWQAHIGGFLVGLLAFPLFDPVPRGPRF